MKEERRFYAKSYHSKDCMNAEGKCMLAVLVLKYKRLRVDAVSKSSSWEMFAAGEGVRLELTDDG